MTETEWRHFDIETCPICGNDLEAETPKNIEEGFWIDGSSVRCVECSFKSGLTACEDGVWVQEADPESYIIPGKDKEKIDNITDFIGWVIDNVEGVPADEFNLQHILGKYVKENNLEYEAEEGLKEKKCLTCRFEPEWKREKSPWDKDKLLVPMGSCKWNGDVPRCMSDKKRVIFQQTPHKNCPVWRPK